ncbi:MULTISPECIES: zinc ribbon domain-containing protein [Methanobacterium]|jgi:hypothetical protein|uniref:Zinc-ribbon domain-containing protein n=1 Tax=Methanobacterium formicicum TaxID=2162 RepID=A0A843AM36_METFO|nr:MULTISPECIES: zinc-ribbon domain-containing protein [Methanobacterium]KUK72735.1 MAG: hypothetical protein XD90_1766 [Methanobacterium sp. 42_16]MBF4475949.1 zinc-ribbon domain-containing protein [Methanobacterium formicicum]MDD4811360.1 zinc-ribbon domain-containing protein [Methanobacterium formicicum]
MRCQNCGYDNDMDATFCEKCGSRLDRYSHYGRQPGDVEKTGMSTSTKLLIVAVIALVAILGVFAGAWVMNPSKTPANTPVSVNESSEKVTYQADWHQVTSFSGVSDDYRSFQIKGQRFKVVMSATPTLNYNTNFMNVDVSGTSGIIGTGNLNWGPDDALSSKEKTVEFTGPPGSYYSQVTTKDLQSWTVTVYDYY